MHFVSVLWGRFAFCLWKWFSGSQNAFFFSLNGFWTFHFMIHEILIDFVEWELALISQFVTILIHKVDLIWIDWLHIWFESMPETRNGNLHRFLNLVQILIQFVSNMIMICFDVRVYSTQILRIVLFQIHKVHKIDSPTFLRIVLFQI